MKVLVDQILNVIMKSIVKCVGRCPLRGLFARPAPSGGVLVLVLVLGKVCL